MFVYISQKTFKGFSNQLLQGIELPSSNQSFSALKFKIKGFVQYVDSSYWESKKAVELNENEKRTNFDLAEVWKNFIQMKNYLFEGIEKEEFSCDEEHSEYTLRDDKKSSLEKLIFSSFEKYRSYGAVCWRQVSFSFIRRENRFPFFHETERHAASIAFCDFHINQQTRPFYIDRRWRNFRWNNFTGS